MSYLNGRKYINKIYQVVQGGKEEQTKTVALDMASGDQVVTPDTNKTLSQVTVQKPATLIPGNIKNGVTIGGVTGSYAGTDTSDADATAGDIKSGKTAYVNGVKLTGTALIATITVNQDDSIDLTIA